MTSLVRRARGDDSAAIAAVHVGSWHETYTGLIPQHVIDARTLQRRENETRVRLADAHLSAHVALVDDTVVGFAMGGPLREPMTGFDGELHVLYVLRQAQRCGFGATLTRAVAQDLRARGCRTMAVLVLDTNADARTFYERLGARYVGLAPPVFVEAASIVDAIYVWDDLARI